MLNKKAFTEYKDKHNGDHGVLFATGPSINKFSYNVIYSDTGSSQEKDKLIKAGVNYILQHSNIAPDLHYYFFGDGRKQKYLSQVPEYTPKIAKFAHTLAGGRSYGHNWHISPKAAVSQYNAIPYEEAWDGGTKFVKDIANEYIFGKCVSLRAIQFMLYTGLQRIYLVGCDATHGLGGERLQWFGDEETTGVRNESKPWWNNLRKFIDTEYPGVEVISVNPIGLKNIMHRDIYV